MRLIGFGALAFALAAFSTAQAEVEYSPNMSLFLSYAFDAAPQSDNSGLRYGLQLDHDWRAHFLKDQEPLLRWEFDNHRFDNLSVAGVPLVSQEMILRQDEFDLPEDDAWTFLKDNFGPIAVGVASAVLVFAVVDGESDAGNRDVGDIDRSSEANTIDCRDADEGGPSGGRDEFCQPNNRSSLSLADGLSL